MFGTHAYIISFQKKADVKRVVDSSMFQHGQLNLVETDARLDLECLRMARFDSTKLQTLQRRGQPGELRLQRGVSVTPHLLHRLGDPMVVRGDFERLGLASSSLVTC